MQTLQMRAMRCCELTPKLSGATLLARPLERRVGRLRVALHAAVPVRF